MTTGLKESIVHSPVSAQGSYPYRSGGGLIPSAEYAVYFNDFFENPSSNAVPGTSAIIDTGATITAAATDAVSYTGVIRITDATASEGAAMYWPKGIQLGLGKKFFMEVRVKTSDVLDNDLQFGLSALTATTNPEDIYTTTTTDLISVGILDGDATIGALIDKNNSGSTVVNAAGTTYDLVADTWTTLAFEVGGTAANSSMWVKVYKDGQLAIDSDQFAETTIPDDLALAPFIAMRNGNGAGGNTADFDYVRWSLER